MPPSVQSTDKKSILPIAAAAVALGCSEKWLRNWVAGKAGGPALPALKVSGKACIDIRVAATHIKQYARRLPPNFGESAPDFCARDSSTTTYDSIEKPWNSIEEALADATLELLIAIARTHGLPFGFTDKDARVAVLLPPSSIQDPSFEQATLKPMPTKPRILDEASFDSATYWALRYICRSENLSIIIADKFGNHVATLRRWPKGLEVSKCVDLSE